MTRKECLEKLKSGDKVFHHLYYTNYNIAKIYFKPLIDDMRKENPNEKIVLHHIELNDQQYENWDTVVPMYSSEHTTLHRKHNNGYKIKDTSNYKNRIPWNKGLTRETNKIVNNISIKLSLSRKGKKTWICGKTKKDYPQLSHYEGWTHIGTPRKGIKWSKKDINKVA
jgi:hypothetical protein